MTVGVSQAEATDTKAKAATSAAPGSINDLICTTSDAVPHKGLAGDYNAARADRQQRTFSPGGSREQRAILAGTVGLGEQDLAEPVRVNRVAE